MENATAMNSTQKRVVGMEEIAKNSITNIRTAKSHIRLILETEYVIVENTTRPSADGMAETASDTIHVVLSILFLCYKNMYDPCILL